MLGVGLHSYGFMQGAMTWLIIFWATQLAIIGLGCLPLKYWQSFHPTGPRTSLGIVHRRVDAAGAVGV